MPRPSSSAILKRILIVLGALALLSTLPVAWSLAGRTEIAMREDLLMQATIASKSIDVYALMKLEKGDKTNLKRLGEQLAAQSAGNERYARLYLLGLTPDGAPALLLDSLPEKTFILNENINQALKKVFRTQLGSVEGPENGGAGENRLSALAPIFSPRTGGVTAVMAIDIDAERWRMEIAESILPSIGFMALFLIVLLSVFYGIVKRLGD